jgi:hypothetical protein
MCMGGGGGGGTITMPDTGAYNRLAQQQMDAMASLQGGAVDAKQQQLNQAITQQQQTLEELRDARMQAANETSANAARLAALIGTPPPEKTAQAPVLGANRTEAGKPAGKKALRIDLRTGRQRSSAGSGLNITTRS